MSKSRRNDFEPNFMHFGYVLFGFAVIELEIDNPIRGRKLSFPPIKVFWHL